MLYHILRKRKYNIILCWKKNETYSTGVHGKWEPWDIGCGGKSAFNKSGIKNKQGLEVSICDATLKKSRNVFNAKTNPILIQIAIIPKIIQKSNILVCFI